LQALFAHFDDRDRPPSRHPVTGVAVACFGAALAIFFLNDLLLAEAASPSQWLLIDVSCRIAALALVLAPATLRRLALSPPRTTANRLDTVLAGAAVLILALVILYGLKPALPKLWNYGDPVGPPQSSRDPLHWLDLTAGLALVAVSEELIARKLLWAILDAWRIKPTGIFVVSSAFFGLFHWSHGLAAVLSTALTGALLMALYRQSGSLRPCIVVHYFVDLFVFT
jgi:membrane protease YdiL (CAAX protease family)